MASAPDLSELPDLPLDDDGPVFREPWEAQAFAMAVRLHEQGIFEWREWATALSEEISRAQARGDPDLGNSYYEHWLAALEKLCLEKDLTTAEALAARKAAWDRAARATPHGEPIELEREVREGKHD
ncbi:MAG: nitrile hydratase accessory protein [Gammaproteobacteria bacterium]|nr:nitrile hydratase accessory protein [Gammaproteobacteria bacterium]